MKGITMQSKVQLNDETKQELTKEVKETVANTVLNSDKNQFTALDLWNQRRNIRSASAMMRKWNLN